MTLRCTRVDNNPLWSNRHNSKIAQKAYFCRGIFVGVLVRKRSLEQFLAGSKCRKIRDDTALMESADFERKVSVFLCVRIKSVCVKRVQQHTFLGVKCKRVDTKPLWSNRHGSNGTRLPPVSCVAHVSAWREWVMSHVWMSHVAQMNKTCRTYQRCTCVAGLVLSFIGIITCWKTKKMTNQLAPIWDFFFCGSASFFMHFCSSLPPLYISVSHLLFVQYYHSLVLYKLKRTDRDKQRKGQRQRQR